MTTEAVVNDDIETLNIEFCSQLMEELEALSLRMRPLFSRSEPWETVRKYLRGLLSFIPRKNSWQLAESVGYQTPHAIQHLLGRALWNPDELRDLLQDEVLENLADPNAVLILDETGFLKKGKHSAGV